MSEKGREDDDAADAAGKKGPKLPKLLPRRYPKTGLQGGALRGHLAIRKEMPRKCARILPQPAPAEPILQITISSAAADSSGVADHDSDAMELCGQSSDVLAEPEAIEPLPGARGH